VKSLETLLGKPRIINLICPLVTVITSFEEAFSSSEPGRQGEYPPSRDIIFEPEPGTDFRRKLEPTTTEEKINAKDHPMPVVR
jgi:hypothetical protein